MTQHINPDELSKNPAFTNVVVVTAPAKTIYIGGQDAVDASGQIVVFRRFWGRRPNPPAISVAFVSALANPDFLVEMDAIAAIPQAGRFAAGSPQ